MSTLQEIFNNREIAIGFWMSLTIIIFLFTNTGKEIVKTLPPILFHKKLVKLYIVFIGYLCLVLYGLYWAQIWDVTLLKDTIFWVIFVELPLFVKAINKAKDGHFFYKLIKENVALIVIIEFFINFWTFSLGAELILFPLTVFISLLHAVSEQDKKHLIIKRFFDRLLTVWGIILIVYATYNTIRSPEQLFNRNTLKSFLLPIVLLILNLPIVYGLALHSIYEQLFIRLKGKTKAERKKMKIKLFLFAGINLSKVTAIRNNIPQTLHVSLTANALQKNLNKLTQRLSLQIGDNYMKRFRFYITNCLFGLIISLMGLILSNSDVTLKDIITFNYTLNTVRLKEIATYVFSTMLVFSTFTLIFALGFGKKKNEEISVIKKFALYELLSAVKRQNSQLQDFPPVDDPVLLFTTYVINAHEIQNACNKALSAYENLLTSWEHEAVTQLKLYATSLIRDLGISTEEISKYDAISFSTHYNTQVNNAPQNEKINTFTHSLHRDIEKYSEQIKLFTTEFKHYY